MAGFDTKQAIRKINELGGDVSGIIAEIESVQQEKKENEGKYQAMLRQVKKVIIDINETKKTVGDAVMKMNVYNKEIAETLRSLQATRSYIIASKESLSQLVQLLYLVQNDYYMGGGEQIDDIKLLLKSDNISETLSTDEIMNSLITQFDTLVEDLTDHQETYTKNYHALMDLRADYKNTVLAYEDKIMTLEEQKAYLMDFLRLYKSNKAVLDAQMNDLFQTRSQLKEKISTVVRSIRDHSHNQAFLNSENYQTFSKQSDIREERRNFFLWPVLPVSRIKSYFATGTTADEFAGITIEAKQFDPIYAPADAIVYKVADQDGIAVNRLMLAHREGYVTVFTNINKALVKEGDIIKRGQIIGLVGGQEGTRGAGFEAK